MAKWSQVNLKRGIWVIPKENVKRSGQKKQPLRVHLSEFALKKFTELHELTGHTESISISKFRKNISCMP